MKSEEPKTKPEKPETEKLKIGAKDGKIEPFVNNKSDLNIDTTLTQYLDKCKDLGVCVEEEAKKPEEPKKTLVQTLPVEFGTVPP